jgi:transposase
MFVTSGAVADCKLAAQLIEGIYVDYLLADKAYDTNEILLLAKANGIEAVIPPKKNRLEQRWFDKEIYRLRHLVENAFLKLKKWRGIATRYAKTTASFLAAVHIRCLALWMGVL